jgi:hypothetical protein
MVIELTIGSTMDQCKDRIVAAGCTVAEARCFDDYHGFYAASVETVPGTMGHPKIEVFARCPDCSACGEPMQSSCETAAGWICTTLGCDNTSTTVIRVQ